MAVGTGVGPGSFFILAMFLLLGLVVASIHCIILAYRSGDKKVMVYVVSPIVLIAVLTVWQAVSDPTCLYTESQSIDAVLEHLERAKHDRLHLGNPKFERSDCSYSFTYEGPDGKYEFLYSNWGEIHTWDYTQGNL